MNTINFSEIIIFLIFIILIIATLIISSPFIVFYLVKDRKKVFNGFEYQ